MSNEYILVSTGFLGTTLLMPSSPELIEVLRDTKIVSVERDAYGLLNAPVVHQMGCVRIELINDDLVAPQTQLSK